MNQVETAGTEARHNASLLVEKESIACQHLHRPVSPTRRGVFSRVCETVEFINMLTEHTLSQSCHVSVKRSSIGHTRSSTDIIFSANYISFLSVCFTSSLESLLFVNSNPPVPMTGASSSIDSPLSLSITPLLFHSRLKTSVFHKSTDTKK